MLWEIEFPGKVEMLNTYDVFCSKTLIKIRFDDSYFFKLKNPLDR